MNTLVLVWRVFSRDLRKSLRAVRTWPGESACYQAMFASTADAVVVSDAEGRVRYINTAATALTGWSAHAAARHKVTEVVCAATAVANSATLGSAAMQLELQTALAGETGSHCNRVRLIGRDGRERRVELQVTEIRGQHGEMRGKILLFHDIGEQQWFEQQLKSSEDRYRSLLAAISNIVWITDANGRFTQDSPSWREFTGQSFEEMQGNGWLEAVHPADRAATEAIWQRAVRTCGIYENEYRLRSKSGGYRHTLVRAVPVLLPGGQVSEWVGMNLDITDRKESFRALQESEERFRRIAAMTCEWIWEQEPSGTYLYSNDAVQDLLGYRAEEVIGLQRAALRARGAEQRTVPAPTKSNHTGARFVRRINTYRHKDGHEVITESTGAPILDSDGKLVKWYGVDYDITDRQRRESIRRRLAAIVESSNDAIIGKDLAGIITSWNKAAERLFGYNAAEVLGQPITLLIPPDRFEEEDHILEMIKSGYPTEHFETIRIRKNGQPIEVALTVSPIRDALDRIVGASKTARDISDRKRAERERQLLLEREQQAREQAEAAVQAKDEFVAMVSHELRTPLNAMLGWVQVMQQTPLVDSPILYKAVLAIARNIELQRQLIDDLLDNARMLTGKLKLEVDLLDLAEVINAALEVVGPAAIARNIELEVAMPEHLGQMLGDSTRLQQIVWNLLSNAIKFTPKGGKVYLTVAQPADQIQVTVRDTGQGIDPELLPLVFDRYSQSAGSRAHRRQAGLGLGLALVRQLVELHGGTVNAESAGRGLGACFTVQLPVLPQPLLPGSERALALLRGDTLSMN